jgi:hypothetical protein
VISVQTSAAGCKTQVKIWHSYRLEDEKTVTGYRLKM